MQFALGRLLRLLQLSRQFTTHAAGHALMRIGLTFQLFKNAETHVRPVLPVGSVEMLCTP